MKIQHFIQLQAAFMMNIMGVFDGGQLVPSQVFSVKFDEGGFYDYYCRLHPWMDGQVIGRWR
ncbi:MAG: hypothetical protein ABI337_00400 [Nitrososphaera sp.]|jgi:plastocyanin